MADSLAIRKATRIGNSLRDWVAKIDVFVVLQFRRQMEGWFLHLVLGEAPDIPDNRLSINDRLKNANASIRLLLPDEPPVDSLEPLPQELLERIREVRYPCAHARLLLASQFTCTTAAMRPTSLSSARHCRGHWVVSAQPN